MLRTIWRNNDRYLAGYWEKFDNRYYVAGDSAHRDKEGYFWIMGRIDDVLNVAGHRLGTMEIESALVAHPRVAEAAVVGRPHEIKGEAVFAYVVTRGQRPTGEAGSLTKELRDWVGQQLGPIAKPDDIRFADNLPKTRSGKIMRRLLKAIARGEEITQDVSTLENPAILEQLRGTDSAAAPARTPAKAAVAVAAAVAVVKGAARRATRRAVTGRAATRGAAARRSPAAKSRKSAAARPAAKRAVRRAAVLRGAKTSRRLKPRAAAKTRLAKPKSRRASASSRNRRHAGGRRSR
jgi:hypothetical protein